MCYISKELRIFPRLIFLRQVSSGIVTDVDVEDTNDDTQVITSFDSEEVVLIEAAAAALLAERVSLTIKLTK